MDIGEQSDMNPNQPFRAESQPQFQAQYPYQPGTSAFSMDQEMNMGADNFAASVQAHADAPHDRDANSSIPRPSAPSLNTSAASMAVAGMAPPQNTSHPYSPGGARQSIDDTQDGGLSGGDQKRKRSKVSRACDECRRKKVRCDAAADDGTIKTCSNCARAGLTCEYSRVPMKRGPSKGYIKELSERVQQVETLQMALSTTPGYRQSLDATGGAYAEQPYSPEDPMSLKRNFSFSADQRNPFVGPEYQRDRMPSVGGWNSGSPQSSIFRARDRGSIAVAPDQQPVRQSSFAKPFWSQDPESLRPAKRQRMDSSEVTKPELGQEFLSAYYANYHLYLPILPDADATVAIVGKATPKVQHAFVAAVNRLPAPKAKTQDEGSDNRDVTSMTPSIFKTRHDLEEHMWNAARESPETRSAEDNMLYLWTYLLMAIEAENDLTRLHDGILPRTVLIKQSVDLGWSCATIAADTREHSIELGSNSASPYLNESARAWHCATVLARLHALAVGSGSPIPSYYQQHFQKKVPNMHNVLPSTGAIVALSAAQFSVVAIIVQDPYPPSQWSRNGEIVQRLGIQEAWHNTINTKPDAPGSESLLEHMTFFLDLTLSRYTVNFHPKDILIPATALAETLRNHLVATEGTFVYNPYNLHFFTLATITLLEFLSESPDTELYRIANVGLEDMKVCLGQISERDHIEDEQMDKSEEADSSEPTRKPVHWAAALLKMIDERVKSVRLANSNGSSNPSTHGPRLGDGTNATIDFSLLLKHGYLNVLAQQVG